MTDTPINRMPTLEDEVFALQALFGWLVRAAKIPLQDIADQADVMRAEAEAIMADGNHPEPDAAIRRKLAGGAVLLETLAYASKMEQILAAARADPGAEPVH